MQNDSSRPFWTKPKWTRRGLHGIGFWENLKSMFARNLIFENRKPGNGILRKLDFGKNRNTEPGFCGNLDF